MQSTAPSQVSPIRKIVFGALAAFILLAPAMPQLLGVHSPIFRPWVMYSGVGLGLLKGDFQISKTGGVETLAPVAFFDLPVFSRTMRLTQPYLTFTADDLSRHIASFCDQNPDVISVSFSGQTALRDGWMDLSADEACAR